MDGIVGVGGSVEVADSGEGGGAAANDTVDLRDSNRPESGAPATDGALRIDAGATEDEADGTAGIDGCWATGGTGWIGVEGSGWDGTVESCRAAGKG